MKKNVLVSLILIVLFGCNDMDEVDKIPKNSKLIKEPIYNTFPGGRVMDSDDPNLDPNFKWYEPENHWVYAKINSNAPTEAERIRMPWFDGQSTLNVPGQEDMLPEDGWRLVARDFGTPSRSRVGAPFLILYNKYRGQLRVLFYNLFAEDKSYAKVTLSFLIPNESSAWLTPMDPNIQNRTLTTYNPDLELVQISEFDKTGGWGVADFHLGYVPDNYADKNAILNFDLELIESEEISGSIESETNGYMAQSGEFPFIKIFENGAKFAGGISDLQSGAGRQALDYGAAVNVVKGAVGLVDYFVGGLNKPTQKQSIKLATSSEVNLIGESSTGYGAINLSLYDESWRNNGQTYKNLYSGNLGLVNYYSPIELFVLGEYMILDDPEFPNGCAIDYDVELKFYKNQAGSRLYVNPDIINNVNSEGMNFGIKFHNSFDGRVTFEEELTLASQSDFTYFSGNKPSWFRDICVFDFIVDNPNSQIMDNEYLAVMSFPVVVLDDYTNTINDCRNY